MKNYKDHELKYYGLLAHYGWFETIIGIDEYETSVASAINCVRDGFKKKKHRSKNARIVKKNL